MPKAISAAEMLSREFLEIRTRLLDVAAALDRIDRREGAAKVRAESRYGQITTALGQLADGRPDRAERLQMLFSDAYQPGWQKA